MLGLAAAVEKKIHFTEGDYIVKTLENESEWRQAYELRHRVFAERLKWVPERPDRLESDLYDAWSTTIGVLADDSTLLGLVRMTHAPVPFMLESEFSACLVGAHQVRKDLDTAEITRLAVDPRVKERGPSTRIMQAAIKGAYQWCLAHDVRYTYIVVEERLFRGLRLMGWPCEAIGEPVALPPAQAVSIAALIDLDEFRSINATKRPDMLNWYSKTDRPLPTGVEPQQPTVVMGSAMQRAA
ncbi:MAG TPA: acyl-homoserine-lactone synthase [Nitrospira sp.]|nr:acyl-homoserine-lactone synthase [Nitrospira sp.]